MPVFHDDHVAVTKLRPDYDNPGKAPRLYVDRLLAESDQGFSFVNPIGIVKAPAESENAFDEAERLHRAWYPRLRRRRRNSWRKDKQETNDRMALACLYEGVVVTKGVAVPYTWWRDCWQNQLEAATAFTQRPDALNLIVDGRIDSLVDLQATEVCHLLRNSSTGGVVHVVFPHLTIRISKKGPLQNRAHREASAWKFRLKAILGKEDAKAVPQEVRLGQIVARDSSAVLYKASLLNALSAAEAMPQQLLER
ncbi:MAG: hypothetical protein R3C18_07045 [Planctomycetaceae bacterium]